MLLSLLEQGMSSASSARVAPGQPGCLARARPPGSRHRRSGARPPPGPVVEPFWDWEAAGATDSLPLLPSPGGGDPSGGPFGPPRRKVHVHRSGKSATSAAAQAWLAPPAEAAGEGGQGEGGEPAAAGAAPAAPTNVHAAAAAPDSQQPASAPASARPDQGGGSSAKGPVGAPSRGITKGQLAAFLAGEGRWRGGRSSSQPARACGPGTGHWGRGPGRASPQHLHRGVTPGRGLQDTAADARPPARPCTRTPRSRPPPPRRRGTSAQQGVDRGGRCGAGHAGGGELPLLRGGPAFPLGRRALRGPAAPPPHTHTHTHLFCLPAQGTRTHPDHPRPHGSIAQQRWQAQMQARLQAAWRAWGAQHLLGAAQRRTFQLSTRQGEGEEPT
jgi:hypothetical protein